MVANVFSECRIAVDGPVVGVYVRRAGVLGLMLLLRFSEMWMGKRDRRVLGYTTCLVLVGLYGT